MRSALRQDVDPEVLKRDHFVPQIPIQFFDKLRHMPVQQFFQLCKDRKSPAKICERSIACISRIPVFLAPLLTGLIILSNGPAGPLNIVQINIALLCEGRVIEGGSKYCVYLCLSFSYATLRALTSALDWGGLRLLIIPLLGVAFMLSLP